MSGMAPLVREFQVVVPAVAAAASEETTLFTIPFEGAVTSVSYVADTAITGAATNSRTFNLRNRGPAGTGTADAAVLAMVAGVNAVAYDERTITLSGTAANLAVVPGDVITWESLSVGTGLADPGGTVFVTVSRT